MAIEHGTQLTSQAPRQRLRRLVERPPDSTTSTKRCWTTRRNLSAQGQGRLARPTLGALKLAVDTTWARTEPLANAIEEQADLLDERKLAMSACQTRRQTRTESSTTVRQQATRDCRTLALEACAGSPGGEEPLVALEPLRPGNGGLAAARRTGFRKPPVRDNSCSSLLRRCAGRRADTFRSADWQGCERPT